MSHRKTTRFYYATRVLNEPPTARLELAAFVSTPKHRQRPPSEDNALRLRYASDDELCTHDET